MIDLDAVGSSPLVSPEDLARRLQRLFDVDAIKDLVGIYPVLVDTHDIDRLVDTFAIDGEFSRAGSSHRGHADLRTFYTHIMKLYTMMVHTQHQHIVQVAEDGQSAVGLTMGHSENLTATGVQINGAYRYDDQYIKVDNTWRFARRQLRYQYMSPNADMGSRLSGLDRIRLPEMAPRAAEIPEDIPSWKAFAATSP